MSGVEPVLSRPSQTSLAHYRVMATAERRAAAITRARAYGLPDDERLIRMQQADAQDREAQRWEALAAELEAFGEQINPEAGEVLL